MSTSRVSNPPLSPWPDQRLQCPPAWPQHQAEHLDINLSAERFQLLDRRWSVDVGPHHQGTAALILEVESQLGGGRCLPAP